MPIPTSHMKERLSGAYVEAVAARAGIKLFGRNVNEYGVDGYFQRIREYQPGKFQETGAHIQCQIKATWVWNYQNGFVVYDMKSEAYDKLVDVVEDDTPTIFILFCMPKEEDIKDWLSVSEDMLVLKNCCYWHFIKDTPTHTRNSTKRVRVPRTQILTPEAIEGFFTSLKKGLLK